MSVGPNRFSFSADMDEASELPEKALNGEFSELPKRFRSIPSKNPKKPAKSSKINKKPLFLKKIIQNKKKLRNLLYEENTDIKILKAIFYSTETLSYSQRLFRIAYYLLTILSAVPSIG